MQHLQRALRRASIIGLWTQLLLIGMHYVFPVINHSIGGTSVYVKLSRTGQSAQHAGKQ
jgi:hypothetical protein